MALPCTERYAAFNLPNTIKMGEKHKTTKDADAQYCRGGIITCQHQALPRDHTIPPFVPWLGLEHLQPKNKESIKYLFCTESNALCKLD